MNISYGIITYTIVGDFRLRGNGYKNLNVQNALFETSRLLADYYRRANKLTVQGHNFNLIIST